MDIVLNDLIEHYKSIMHDTIWEIKEEKYTNSYDYYNIDIKIKNTNSYWYKDSFRIYCEEIYDITKDNVNDIMLDNLTKSMNKILSNVNKYDGIDSTYRHMLPRRMED
jgi:hypothetical protein